MKRVTRNESLPARQFGEEVIKELHEAFKGIYKFEVRLVGSARWNIILKEEGKPWDIDYQILLTKNSKAYKLDKFDNPTKIKEDFFNYFNNRFKDKNGFKVENSTTAIALINNNSGYSFDFVIIKDGNQIIRRNNNDHSGRNMYTWNKLGDYDNAYYQFFRLTQKERINLIEEHILPRKKKEKAKVDYDPTKRSSSEVFIEEVNNYVYRKSNS